MSTPNIRCRSCYGIGHYILIRKRDCTECNSSYKWCCIDCCYARNNGKPMIEYYGDYTPCSACGGKGIVIKDCIKCGGMGYFDFLSNKHIVCEICRGYGKAKL